MTKLWNNLPKRAFAAVAVLTFISACNVPLIPLI